MQMKKFLVTLGLMSLLCSVGFAQNYIVTNDNNSSAGNSATAYSTASSGGLHLVKKLSTGGYGLGGGYFASTDVAATSNASCVFVANTDTNTISAFKMPGYTEVGSYGEADMFSTYGEGGSIALHPSGKLLVAGQSGLKNIGAYSISSGCVLTHLADYSPSLGSDNYGPIAFTPDGAYVVVPAPDLGGAELFKVNPTGTLTDIGNINFYSSVSQCDSVGCYPTGMDFTSDSKLVLFGNATSEGSVLSASISSSGLSNGQLWDLNSAVVGNINVPHFTKAARGGSGILLLGGSGFYSTSGILCTNFTESPLNISVVSITPVTKEDNLQGAIVTFGNEGWAAEYPSTIQSFSISSNCGITLGATTTDSNSNGLLSIVGYPANQ
jgi:6-phosphogluconolactonase (cycloisomerase 2 family)